MVGHRRSSLASWAGLRASEAFLARAGPGPLAGPGSSSVDITTTAARRRFDVTAFQLEVACQDEAT